MNGYITLHDETDEVTLEGFGADGTEQFHGSIRDGIDWIADITSEEISELKAEVERLKIQIGALKWRLGKCR
ncbi:MAG: hypothetical protein KGJ09_09295 [Candidatus Omnitrophica bacterium]|nr:hypothetical protein [Candidatus Omnitrophota bacterium]